MKNEPIYATAIRLLEVNEAHVFPWSQKVNQAVTINSIASRIGRKTGAKFQCRAGPDGYQVWRRF